MDTFSLLAVLTTIAALFSWLNHRFIRLPNTIGLMVLSLVFSLALVIMGKLYTAAADPLRRMLVDVDLDRTLLHGMLGALLFAGALHLNINDLLGRKYIIGLLATTGVIISILVVGFASWGILRGLGFSIDMTCCLLFGALISPTDPIAVGAILRKAGIPKTLETKISGESLFNDGVGVVVFLTLLEATAGHHVSAGSIAILLAVEIIGGLAFGAMVGWVVYLMLKSIDSYEVEILLTLAIVTGGYALAQQLHVSGPLAMVVAGLLIGNRGRSLAMSEKTRERLDAFWELADEFLNAVLFVIIGAEIIVITYTANFFLAGVIAIPLVLFARWISVSVPILVLRRRRTFSPHVIKILTWSGLRGGISVALALSLPKGPERSLFVAMTYIIVIFSIVVQGLTIGRFVERLYSREPRY
ncbi:MAG: sodium:proton antiporter [Candidatus Latescibacteria bacterium]|nr:sodium:proton antiporter [Candidatus Latescibacterota bacterium]NIO56134.1 sodium:proton antiporter [Candidatus Latescibacterota bacterium]